MTTDAERRQQLADAVTAAGIPCLPYQPDTLAAPLAYVATIATAYTAGGVTTLGGGTSVGVVTLVEQRNDLPGAIASLETLKPTVVAALNGLDDALVLEATPDYSRTDNRPLPALDITVQFPA